MTPDRARELVLLAMAGTGVLVVVSEVSSGAGLPAPRRVLALGVTFLGLSALTTVAPALGASMAGVVFAGTLIRHGDDAALGILAAAESSAPLSGDARPLAAPVAPSGASPSAPAGTGSPPAVPSTPAPLAGPGSPAPSGRSKPVGASYRPPGPHGSAGNAFRSTEAADIFVPVGTPALAVAAGVIESVRSTGNFSPSANPNGIHVYLRADSGHRFFYTHLFTVRVRPGQRVRAGEVIGTTGAANNAAHLHFEVDRGSIREWV